MLPHLVIGTWRSVLWVAMIALLVGAAAALVRLLPWIAARDVPAAVSLVFLQAMLLASTEVALVLSLPLGIGIEVVGWGHNGTVSALRALGVGPLRQAANALSVLVLLGLAIVAVSWHASVSNESPGQLSNALLDAAEELDIELPDSEDEDSIDEYTELVEDFRCKYSLAG